MSRDLHRPVPPKLTFGTIFWLASRSTCFDTGCGTMVHRVMHDKLQFLVLIRRYCSAQCFCCFGGLRQRPRDGSQLRLLRPLLWPRNLQSGSKFRMFTSQMFPAWRCWRCDKPLWSVHPTTCHRLIFLCHLSDGHKFVQSVELFLFSPAPLMGCLRAYRSDSLTILLAGVWVCYWLRLVSGQVRPVRQRRARFRGAGAKSENMYTTAYNCYFFCSQGARESKQNRKKNKLPKKRPCGTSILYKRDILPSYSEIGGLLSDISDGRFERHEQFKTTSASQSSRFLVVDLHRC